MTTTDERRQAVLGLLAQHGDVTWHQRTSAAAFADEVCELAQRLGRHEVVPLRPSRVATDAERRRHLATIRATFERSGAQKPLSGDLSDETGSLGTPGDPQASGTTAERR